MKKVLWFGIAAMAAAMTLASPASAWQRGGFIRPPMQFHPGFAPQFHPGPRFFGGGPRYGGGGFYGGGVIIQPPVMTCTSSHTGALLHYGPCDGSELACFGPDGGFLYDGPCVDSE
ncbi:MAG TPA: hypothetical protein VMR46_02210 [Candidatus Paceibacterota bacterium]|jgi:hypothetical protein|nr:hypothetical protein [Candidatus Paceibacterota bacterium]